MNLPERPRILVLTLRRLGDVLLTTPLVRTLRRGHPDARIDILVFRSSAGVLQGNPDIDDVLAVAERATAGETLRLVARIWRRYDLVVSTQPGDRPTFLALAAGRRRVGLVPVAGDGAWWKRHAHHRPVAAEPDIHRVEQLFALTGALDLPQVRELVPPRGSAAPAIAPRAPYAVLHPNPMYRYKRWNDAAWRALAAGLRDRGLEVIVSEGPDAAERAYVDGVFGDDAPVTRTWGCLDWAALAALIRGADVYVGTDTSVTHLASACGRPTVALYGPTSPRLIGPWPVGGLAEPWDFASKVQRRGNVWLLQNPLPCVPCERLGCERHLDSVSVCLDELRTADVLAAVDEALGSGVASRGKGRYEDADSAQPSGR